MNKKVNYFVNILGTRRILFYNASKNVTTAVKRTGTYL